MFCLFWPTEGAAHCYYHLPSNRYCSLFMYWHNVDQFWWKTHESPSRSMSPHAIVKKSTLVEVNDCHFQCCPVCWENNILYAPWFVTVGKTKHFKRGCLFSFLFYSQNLTTFFNIFYFNIICFNYLNVIFYSCFSFTGVYGQNPPAILQESIYIHFFHIYDYNYGIEHSCVKMCHDGWIMYKLKWSSVFDFFITLFVHIL